jgi:acyl-coenzyme A thioesterase 13
MSETSAVPEGFRPSERSSPLLDLIGPLYVAEHDGSIIVGLRAEPRHANGRGAIHAAVLSALSDIALGRNAAATYNPPQHIVTVNLSIDFIAAANPDNGSKQPQPFNAPENASPSHKAASTPTANS